MKKLKLYLRVAYLLLYNKKISKSDIAKSYDRVSSTYQEYFLKEMKVYNDEIISRYINIIPLKSNITLLDLACGTGYNTKKLSNYLTESNYLLSDNSNQMLKYAKKNTNDLNSIYLHDDMINCLEKLEDESIDLIICTWALKYQNINKILKLGYRKLKNNGYFICIVNTKDTLKEIYPVYYELLEIYQSKINKVMLPLPNPINKNKFVRLFTSHKFKEIISLDKTHTFSFDSSSNLVDFITKTGALAGFDQMLDLHNIMIKDTMISICDQKQIKDVTHKFVMGVFKKEV